MLNVYKASAGSGKTFTLAYEYIKLLLGRYNKERGNYVFYDNYHNSHRRILAVTFTNKATDEMKRRIVKELEVLAHNPSESDYCKPLCEAYVCDETKLQQKASLVLEQLLHDFSYFNISTIDSFFQQVLRAFTREVGLQGGYEVEMNAQYVTLLAVDRMFDELEGNEKMYDWLLQFAYENIRNGKGWNIYERSDISTLAKQLTSEVYRNHREALHKIDFDTFNAYVSTLDALKNEIRQGIAEAATAVITVVESASLPDNIFSYEWIKWVRVLALVEEKGWGTSEPFKAAIEAFKKNYEKSDRWFVKKRLKENSLNACDLEQKLRPSLDELKKLIDATIIKYVTALEIDKHIYALGVLSTIDKYISEYEREHNTLLLSKTPEILSGLINKSDAPFIYEKVGTRIAHYMIDEFQDTSRLQWSNFMPLIDESMAWSNENLIVGDVKQSIYRFRNSDWKLLHNDIEAYKYHDYNADKNTNWRSCAGVVAFNNRFFKLASQFMQDRLENICSSDGSIKPVVADIYKKVAQTPSHKLKDYSGHVEAHILKLKNKYEFYDEVDRRLIVQLKTLLEKGYKQRDIVFLVRNKEEGRRIVELLLAVPTEADATLSDLRVISDESLLITNAPPVKLIIGILSYLQNPTFPLNEFILSYEYDLIHADETMAHISSKALVAYFDKRETDNILDAELKQFLEEIYSLPLYEMCERIIHKFKMHCQADYVAYIEAFQDMVLDYCHNNQADLYSFLRWWSENESSAAVKSPEKVDAITVMTIHKAKGLEFPVVIIPYAAWSISSLSGGYERTLQWCEPDCEPFNQIPVLPVNFSQNLASTIFASQFYEELINEYIDNLNVTYVAFTRACQELIIYSYDASQSNIGSMLSEALECMTVDNDDECVLCKRCDENEDVYEIGASWQPLPDKKQTARMLNVAYRVEVPDKNRLKQRISSRNKSGNYMRDYGILMHEILSEIGVAADIHQVVQRYVQEGRVRYAQASAIEARIGKWLATEGVERWFAPDVRIVTETDIIKWGEKIQRPDRIVIDGSRAIVIDYKFGKVVDEDYSKQVARYVELMQQMGYDTVEGYVWYVTRGEIERVH